MGKDKFSLFSSVKVYGWPCGRPMSAPWYSQELQLLCYLLACVLFLLSSLVVQDAYQRPWKEEGKQ